MNKKSLHKLKLPDKPGIYFFLGAPKRSAGGKKGRDILYIGKATSLRDRVRSYLSKDIFDMRGPLVEKMVKEVDKIDWQVTDSVLEALILEAELIKKHQPKYNTKEKSDKSFNFVCVIKDKLPKVVIIRGSKLKNFSIRKSLSGKVFGPYTSGSQLHEALKIIRKIFPFLDDKSKNYIEFYRQINLIPDLNDHKLYLQNIKNIKLFLSGRKKQVFKNLKKEMHEYAKLREFEKAGEIKRQLFALKHINDIALLKNAGSSIFSPLRPFPSEWDPRGFKNKKTLVFRIEAYDIAHMSGKNMVGVMIVVEKGEPVKSGYKKFRIKTQAEANDTGALAEILERRFAHKEWGYPNLLVVDGGVAQIGVAKSVLRKIGVKVPIVSVLKDDRHKPKAIMGGEEIASRYKSDILLANNEAHRFAIAFHKKVRARIFLSSLPYSSRV